MGMGAGGGGGECCFRGQSSVWEEGKFWGWGWGRLHGAAYWETVKMVHLMSWVFTSIFKKLI